VSLIADALDAAQRERAKRTGVRQPAIHDGITSFRSVTKKSRAPIPREVGIALAGLAAVIVVASGVSIITANSRSKVNPVIGSSAPPIPLPVQSAAESTNVLAPAPIAAADTTLATTAAGYDGYDRAIQEYDTPTLPPASGYGKVPQSTVDELIPPADDTPAPQATPKGSFKITMQTAPASVGNDRVFQQGLAAQQRGDFTVARDLYIKSIAETPGNAAALNNLGAVYRSLGNLKLAEEYYRKALDADPKFAPAWSNLAVVYDSQGKRQEATAALQESLRLDPRNVSTKVNLAIQFSALGVYPDARRLLEEALRDNSSLAEAHYTLGQVMERQGDKEQASIQFRAFLATSKGRFPKQEAQVRQHLKELGFSVQE
jgi:tetratricopeptide (TPR) repeat protein